MRLIMVMNGWLRDCNQTLGFDLRLNDEGVCAIQCQDMVCVIEKPVGSDLFHIYTSVCQLVGSPQDIHILRYALEMNMFNLRTRGGSLGMMKNDNQIFYCFSEAVEQCDSVEFINILYNFIETALDIKKDINLFYDNNCSKSFINPSEG